MKKFIVFSVMVLMSTCLFAAIEVNSSTASGLDVSVTIPELQIVEARSTDGNMYSKIIVPQASQVEVSKPDVPAFARWILIPNGTSVNISTYPGEPVVYENIELAPVQPSPIDRLDAPLPPFTKDELVFSTNADYPGVFAQAEPTKNKRGQSLTILWVYPYQYNPVQKTLIVYPDLEVSINFFGSVQPIPFNLKNENLENYLRSIAINADEVLHAEEDAESLQPEDNTRTAGCELLIITDPDFVDAANTLADWRIRRGIYTKVVTTTTTGTTTNQIDNYINNAYDNWTPAPSYFLFVGDAEDIPVWYDGDLGTDFFYADYDNPSDYVADFGYGRLSVDTDDQADSLVARIIRYERSPTTSASYYTNIFNAACFQDGEYWGTPTQYEEPDSVANRRFCKTSEDVRNYLHDWQGYPWSQREYVAYNRVSGVYPGEIFPKYWNDYNQKYHFIFDNDTPGAEIPWNLQKPTFPWDGNTADISTAFNNGVFMALFRAHGSRGGWGDPDFHTWNVDALTNGEKRPIVWSITCQSGWFDNETSGMGWNSECFAEHWLRHNTGGSCGIIAATRNSYSGHNDRFIWGMMDAVWPSFLTWANDLTYPANSAIYRMGDVVNYGKDYMALKYGYDGTSETTIELFHWFGDPTMEMWTSQPSQLTSAQVTSNIDIGTSSITVQINPSLSGFLVSICSENGDGIFGTATTNASGVATVYLNHAITMPGEFYITITKHNYKPYEFKAGWNTWTGDYNNYWGNATNWSLGHIATSGENVIIPNVGYQPVIVDYSDKTCNDLTIYSGATVQIKDQRLSIDYDMTIHGELIMSDTAAELYIGDDIVWESGSSASITGSSAKIRVEGDWNFESGANVQLDMGYVDFNGDGNTWIRCYDEDCYFNHIRNYKSGTYSLNVSEMSTDDLSINGNIYNYSGSRIKFRSSHSVFLNGFLNNMGGYFEGQYGTFVYSGNPSVVSLKPNTDCYFNNLIIDTGTSNLTLGSDYSSTLTINGDFTLDSGYFYPGSFTVEVSGNWTNNAGIDHFVESSSRVIFNGPGHQYVYSDETFNILEVDCGAALRVNNVNHTVTCSTYDWTSGGIDVVAGNFTAIDLYNSGLLGTWWCNPNGTITLTQDGGQYVDLRGEIHIFGGTMTVNGGLGASYWPYINDAVIQMTGGVLDFPDSPIRLDDNAHTLTVDITGGTIKTRWGFWDYRGDFTPDGGTIELYGSADATVIVQTGSNFHNLEINKFAPSEDGDTISKALDFVIVKERDGTETRIERSNTIYAGSVLDINGDVIIDAGVFNPNDSTMYVEGDWTNNVGDAGFVEGTGLVVFDGATAADITTNETFYDMELDKTYATYDALEIGAGNDNGVDVTILHNLILTDGTLELNSPTNVAIGNNISIESGASLNANDGPTVNISVVEDWFDFNTSGGFAAGSYSVVTFNGPGLTSLHSIRENDYFNNIIINSASAYLRPSNVGPVLYCKNMDIQTGKLKLSGYKVVVDNVLNISDRVEMTNANDSLVVGDIIWQPGSNDVITEGSILVSGDWTFANGTNADMGSNNAVYFDGATSQFIYCMDADAEFNDVVIDQSGGSTWIHSTTTDPMRVMGDMTVTAGDVFQVQQGDLLIDGTLDVQSTGKLYLEHTGGTLTNNSDFILNGELNIDGGDALIHGMFELASTGILTIDSGSFICDAPYAKDRAIQSMYGTMNMTNGLFEITNNHISIKSSFVENISGGRIRCGGSFMSNTVNTFQPTGGVLELTSNSPGRYLQCTNGNYVYNLEINTSQSMLLYDDATVYNDLEIIAGILNSNNKYLYVGGNWTNNVGDAGFVEGTGTVIFYGGNESDIITNEKFYDLSVDKYNSSWQDVEIMDGMTVNVLHDLALEYGTLEMNTGSTLHIGNDLNIALGAGLNAYLDTGLSISVGGNWTNYNTMYDSWVGFYPGTSTVYFNGTDDQILGTSAPQEEFYNVIIDKTSMAFKPADNIWVYGDLELQDGVFSYYTAGLNHYLFGDVYIQTAGEFYPSNTVTFKGTSDQIFDHQGTNNGYLFNVVVDKTSAKSAFVASPNGEGSNMTYDDEGSKGQTVTLNTRLLSLANGSLTIDEGILDLNGNYIRCTGNVTVNDGGKIAIDDNAWLEVGNGYTLDVNDGGTLEVIGSAGNEGKVTHHSGYYDFHIEAGGTISAEHGIFEYMTGNGVYVKQNGLVDPLHAFNHCTFRNGTSGYAALLILNNDQTLTCTGAHFPGPIVTEYNVWKYLDTGHVTFVDASGDFAGEDYDYDPYGRIDWTTGGQPDLTITNVVWSNTNPYVSNNIDVSITVKNIGVADVTDLFYVDLYYNLTAPPTPYEIGDQTYDITTGLPAGDSLIVQFSMICNSTPGIWHSYVQVDTDLEVAESDEGNNIWGPDTITWQALPVIDDLAISYSNIAAKGSIELSWTYSTTADSFYIYRDTDPYFTPATPHAAVEGITYSWSEPASGTKYFYQVTAVKSCPMIYVVTKDEESRRSMINRKN